MKVIRGCAAVVVLLATAILTAGAEPKADPREKLDTAIPDGIRLLEAKEHLQFLKTYLSPDDLKRITDKGGTIEELAKSFGQEKADRLLRILKEIKGSKPTLDADESKATYELKEKVDGKNTIHFVKVDKLWYLKN